MGELDQILNVGGVVGGIAIAIKLVWPVVSKQSEASTSRLETDATLHDLYQKTLKAQQELADALNKAREEIGALRLQVGTLTKELHDARTALAKAEESLALQSKKAAPEAVK